MRLRYIDMSEMCGFDNLFVLYAEMMSKFDQIKSIYKSSCQPYLIASYYQCIILLQNIFACHLARREGLKPIINFINFYFFLLKHYDRAMIW